MNVGIVGFGSIGTEVGKALINGVEDFSLYGVTSRSKAKALKKIAKLNNALLREPSPKPSSANLFKHGGPSSNISTAFDFFIIIFSICSFVCTHSSLSLIHI